MFDWLNSNSATAQPSDNLMASVQTATGSPAATQAATSAVPGVGVSVPGVTGAQGGSFLGPNFAQNAGLVLGGVQALGSLWNSYQSNKLAKESIGLQREAFQTNLANTKKTYNTALEDRIRSRYNTEGRSSAEADSYVNKHSL